jgi:hypothetical protein
MPLNTLVIEVDDIIIEILCASDDYKALSSLSCVSKYYRGLVEPLSHRDLMLVSVAL